MPTTASIRINGGPAGLADTNLPLGTVVNLANNDNTGVVSYEWVIVSQPAGDQDDLIPFTTNPIVSEAAAPEFTPTKEGSYLIRLTVNKDMADEATDTTICAVRELLTGDRIPAPQETTEVNEEYGWATAAVTKILQRVTRLSDAGIFVAQNASGVSLALGKVVHMNGMSTLGTGSNERPIPTVGLARANLLELVDGPLGVAVGNRDGDTLPVANGELCRVMVMGGIANYTGMGIGGVAGDPVFVDNAGNLSLTAGDYARQVGDIARTIVDGEYDIAISAGANSIPRGNAGGDLEGMYPDPTVGKLRGVPLDANIGTPAYYDVIRYDPGVSAWNAGKVNLGLSAGDPNGSVVGSLKTENGGTGAQLPTLTQGGVIYAASTESMGVTASGTAGYLLKSNGTAAPSWIQTVPVANGGTGSSTALTAQGVIYAANTTTMLSTTAGTAGQPLLSFGGGTAPGFGSLNLGTAAAVTGTLPVNRGGTGSSSALTAGGVIYAQTASIAISTPAAAGLGYILCSNSASVSDAPEWVNVLSVAHGGTGDSSLTLNGVLYGNGTAAVGQTAAGASGDILVANTLAAPSWKAAGNAGDILTLTMVGGFKALDWQDFAAYFDANYAGSTTSTDGTYSTTGGVYSEIVAVTRACKKGMVQVTPMAIAGGSAFLNYITTAANNTYSTVFLQFVVTFPDTTTQTYSYQFRTAVAHNNNQNTGSITFPALTFYTSQTGNHTVSLQATISPTGDTFTVQNIALRISQG